jgi:hypothetical protein
LFWQAVLAGGFGAMLYARQLIRAARSWIKMALGQGQDPSTSANESDRARLSDMNRHL